MEFMLKGEPQTPAERLARARERLQYERDAYLMGGAFAEEERVRLERRATALERDAERLASLEPGTEEYERAFERFDAQDDYVDRAIEDHRTAVDSATDLAATIAGVVATVVVIVGAIVLTVVTGGAAGVALGPALAAAAGSVMTSAGVAAAAAGAAALATVGTKLAFKGSAYGAEEMGVDLAIGAVDAIAASLTAGLGAKLLSAGRLARLAESNTILPRLVASAMAEGAEGFASSPPSALTGSLLNDKNWEGENSFGKHLRRRHGRRRPGIVLGAGLGSLGGLGKPAETAGADAADVIADQAARRPLAESADVLARRGTPAERLAGWRGFRESNPGKSYDDFLR